MTLEPKVDILLASYNGRQFIEEQINSILQQTYSNFRIVIRDDGSDDGTVAIIDAFCAAHPCRMVRIRDGLGNLGAAGNFAALLDHSQAPYVMFSDQDDIWFPFKVAATLALMQRVEGSNSEPDREPVLVYSDVVVVDVAGRELAPSYFAYTGIEPDRTSYPALFLQNTVIGCTAMVNRALLAQAMPIPADAAMHDWWLALVAAGLGRTAMLNQPTLQYRQHSANEVGASRYGLRSVLQLSPQRLRTARRNYRATVMQVRLLLERYGLELGPEQRPLAERFVGLSRLGWLQRRREAWKMGLRKSGGLRTLLLYALI